MYLKPLSFPILSLYRMVLVSGQYCVHSLQLFAAQISILISATIHERSFRITYFAAAAATGSSARFTSEAAQPWSTA